MMQQEILLPVVAMQPLSYYVGHCTLKRNKVVAEITDDVLLGSDIILGDESGPTHLLFRKHMMILRGRDIPIEIMGYPTRVCRIKLANDYRIAP